MKFPDSFPRLKGLEFGVRLLLMGYAYRSFALSAAAVEDPISERGMIVIWESVCFWINYFGRYFANCVRKERPEQRWYRHRLSQLRFSSSESD